MKVRKLETEKNYNKDGLDRVWYTIEGFIVNPELNGVYGIMENDIDTIVLENGENIDDALPDNDAIVVRTVFNNEIIR